MSNAPARPPRLIVGLGNPGAEYSETRHNAGFWFCERLADTLGVRFSHESRFHGLVANAREAGAWLLMPQTFMNRSGLSVVALAGFYKILPDEILVVHDELDLSPGDIRIKQGGGNGGHNGLKDIQAHLSVPDFWRLRIGIGHPGERSEVINYVLKAPRKEEQALIDRALDRCLLAWPKFAAGDFAAAQRLLHRKDEVP